MNTAIIRSLLYVFLLTGNMAISYAGPLRDFVAGSYHDILAARPDKAFVMVFWSMDCPPCHRELAMLGRLRQQPPQFDLVLIATDENTDHAELQTVLAKHRLDKSDTWVFAGESAAALRYEIDPTWYGELPRSYLFNSRHQRQAVSGLLSAEGLQAWLRDNSRALR